MKRKTLNKKVGDKIGGNAELLNELYRLNRSGVINDQEFLILRKIVGGRNIKPENYRDFERLFLEKKPRVNEARAPEIDLAEPDDEFDASDILKMAAGVDALRRQLSDAGRFDDSRELVVCHHCGLTEDVTFDGLLITCERLKPGIDTGKKFAFREHSGDWICPACGASCRES